MAPHAVTPGGATLPGPPAVASALVDALTALVGGRHVKQRASELRVYDSDGLPGYHRRPALAVFPGTRDELIAVVRALAAHDAPFVARGAGTGLSGGALADGVVILGLNRLTRILSIDPENRLAVVEPGVVNVTLTRAVAPFGLHYAPDPSSQSACTIGGNVAENAGGPHCLKYGVTLNHVAAVTVVLPMARSSRWATPTARPAATICSARSSAARDASASPSTSPSGWRPIPKRCARCSPTSRVSRMPRARCRASSPPASCPPRSR
jgi:FAD/FMN-containing dehydrogenase